MTALQRLFANDMLLYFLDLPTADLEARFAIPEGFLLERKAMQSEIGERDWEKIVNFWNSAETQKNFRSRFEAGATLWLARCAGELAGFGWTLTGTTIAPHYHPLGSNDVHMFDYLVFPEFRGRNLNPSLVLAILRGLREEGRARAYIEVREWNKPQISSLSKIPFQLFGRASKLSLFGQTYVHWKPVSEAAAVRARKDSQQRFSREVNGRSLS